MLLQCIGKLTAKFRFLIRICHLAEFYCISCFRILIGKFTDVICAGIL